MIAERLKLLRKERGLTLKQLGLKVGLAENTVSQYERAVRKPDIDTVERFARFFEVPIDYLQGRSDSRLFTKTEQDFLNDIHLPIEELKRKYDFIFENKDVNDEKLKEILIWISNNRKYTDS
ncbi:helix-turn-helix transcriptional regulator [Sutcliffiella horikoshii]|uniref:Helix-turn-helix transcriptional regulator n=1 Tax=Sutcliffiella horikoshii TaxID=79883 RepID=A0A5D4SCZ1_9BACI|nr:helix-turn-helix transcriptional regulator [Sutcliffiella horikoshii]TYS60521.1 helix-turn-helix transcriptional regulator [Sutcliffiella horikoshii]